MPRRTFIEFGIIWMPGADAGKARRLLVELDVDADTAQRRRDRQSAIPAPTIATESSSYSSFLAVAERADLFSLNARLCRSRRSTS
jgi:hypothetical protein